MTDTIETTERTTTDGSALARLPAVSDALTHAVEALVRLKKYEADRLGSSAASALI